MKITFEYHAQIRGAAGTDLEVTDVPEGASLAEALSVLADRHGPVFRSLVLADDNRILPSLLVIVNGTPAPRDAATPLADNDVVVLLSAMAGG